MIYLDKNYIYAKKLSELVEKMIKISNKISNKFSNVNQDMNNNEKLKNRYNNYLKAIHKYKKCKTSLNNIVPPSKVKIEHKKMIDAIQVFIEGTNGMFNSINIDNCSVDKGIMNKGILIQELGKKTVVTLSHEISTVLIA